MGEFFIWRSRIVFILYLSVIAVILNASTASAFFGISREEALNYLAKSISEGKVNPITPIFDTPCKFYKNSSGVSSSEIIPQYSMAFITKYLKNSFDDKVEPNNPVVNNYALQIAGVHSGDLTIDQICAIYDYLKQGRDSIKGWSYVNDPHGVDLIRYANNTIDLGKKIGRSGVGDCDDFAILMSSLIESIGGSTRIIFAFGNNSGHAYTEVYLGELGTPNHQVEKIIEWLMIKYNVTSIFTHIQRSGAFSNETKKEVWLNLDWGPDENGYFHPGGPFFEGDEETIYVVRDFVKERSPLSLDYVPEDIASIPSPKNI